MKRFVPIVLALGCNKPGPGLIDGGGFMLPDAGVRDVGETPIDTGVPDAGPICDPPCPGNETCAAAREHGNDVFLCTDGAENTACSHTQDLCTTALGCVCLTDPTSTTDCRCTESVSNPTLCDRMVPESCPGKVCVRVEGPNGVYFYCSGGASREPCDPAQDNCQTSLGCTCPLVDDIERCQCSEPAPEGAPCDINVAGACQGSLMCVVAGNPLDGRNTICTSNSSVPDGGMPIPCDPNNPTSCPPGQTCVETEDGFVCV
jgi:hypothetical protein